MAASDLSRPQKRAAPALWKAANDGDMPATGSDCSDLKVNRQAAQPLFNLRVCGTDRICMECALGRWQGSIICVVTFSAVTGQHAREQPRTEQSNVQMGAHCPHQIGPRLRTD